MANVPALMILESPKNVAVPPMWLVHSYPEVLKISNVEPKHQEKILFSDNYETFRRCEFYDSSRDAGCNDDIKTGIDVRNLKKLHPNTYYSLLYLIEEREIIRVIIPQIVNSG